MKTPVESMTDEELRIEIAEFCGWKKVGLTSIDFKTPIIAGYPFDTPQNILDNLRSGKLSADYWIQQVPNYPQSLDAMWEAEEKAFSTNWEAREAFNRRLISCQTNQIVCNQIGHSEAYLGTHATAKQRAIAFVKTIREIKK